MTRRAESRQSQSARSRPQASSPRPPARRNGSSIAWLPQSREKTQATSGTNVPEEVAPGRLSQPVTARRTLFRTQAGRFDLEVLDHRIVGLDHHLLAGS